jgi:hypothetical protein
MANTASLHKMPDESRAESGRLRRFPRWERNERGNKRHGSRERRAHTAL